ncbi:MAG: heme ABC transporter ATP-binding protein [Emcibacteraceae bacterium]
MAYKCEKISVFAGRKVLVNDISLSVKPGQLSVILGPNGAGKSTLLKALSGDIRPDRGEVMIDGKSTQSLDRKELAMARAVLPQLSNVTFNFSALDIVKMGRLPYNECERISLPIVAKAMSLTRTSELQSRQFITLSGGEKQRVQFARILTQIWPELSNGKTKYLLLDEPTGALDPLYQMEILNIARWLAEEKGFGVLAVLHDLNQAMVYADYIYLLKQGRLVSEGQPQTVLTRSSIRELWGIDTEIIHHKSASVPYILPYVGKCSSSF